MHRLFFNVLNQEAIVIATMAKANDDDDDE